MAIEKMAEELKHSRVLFTEEDGSAMLFSLRICPEKKKLRPLIEHGGGKLTSVWDQKAIRLAVPGDSISSENYVSIRYVEDCVKENNLLDIASYRMNKHGVSELDDMEPASVIIKTTARERKGRRKFTLEEDKKIIKYLIEERRYTEMKGNAVWKDMEILKITNHTCQSMKDRFKKQILPNIHSYKIPKSWVSALTGVTSDARKSPVPGTSKSFRGFSPLFCSPENITSKSIRTNPAVPLQSTPIKNREERSQSPCRNRSDSDSSEETAKRNDLAVVAGKATNESSSRGGIDELKCKSTSVSDQSDEDEFDKELLKMADGTDENTLSPTNKGLPLKAKKMSDEQQLRKSARISQSSKELSGPEESLTVNSSSPVRRSLQQSNDLSESETEKFKSTVNRKDSVIESAEHSLESGKRSGSPPRKRSGSPHRKSLGSPPRKSLGSPPRKRKRNLPGGPLTDPESSPEKQTCLPHRQVESEDLSTSSAVMMRKKKFSRIKPIDSESSPEQQKSLQHKQSPSAVDARSRLRRSERNQNSSIHATTSSKNEVHVTNSSRQALTSFVMDTDHTGSEIEVSAEDDTATETDLENSAGPDEVKKHCEIVKRLCSKFGMTPGDVLSALWANSGSLKNTVHWIQYGLDTSGCPAWTEEDDALLGSTQSKDINSLRQKYGPQKVDQRAAFLEDSFLK